MSERSCVHPCVMHAPILPRTCQREASVRVVNKTKVTYTYLAAEQAESRWHTVKDTGDNEKQSAVEIMARGAPLLAAAVIAAVALGSVGATEQEAAGGGDDDLSQPPVAQGLSFDFYRQSCPRAESIVHDFVRDVVSKDVGLAAGLLRPYFLRS
ncbi:hypothetical protein VPH35_056494 [Triticum aestivum]|uniref:Plant heme peroxidase family profile domain-containing protein n=1 Tax=Triticum aestivum TaxID=4565 RepID=A0A080YU46_WHEAT|nr:unnamed protein product [Triticum aestivum]CDM86900.1 unnamed protein product [Triticum aestivum]